MKHILKCPVCKKYTLKEECCAKTERVKPMKYSPQDKYASYRRKAKCGNQSYIKRQV